MFDFDLLIPCYNNLEGLIRSLQSVEYPAHLFSVTVVDDGSDERITTEIIYTHIATSLRIDIVRLEKNLGITKALNAGLLKIQQERKAEFVARLDCGDICSPERFYYQVAFLRAHKDIDLAGSWCLFKDFQSGSSYKYVTPTGHASILRSMHFRNVFIHPTVMWRMPVEKELYPETFPHAEDYGFFYRFLNHKKTAVIPDYLVTCEINHQGISLTYRKEQLKSRMKVVKAFGKNRFLSVLGVLKLRILMMIPSSIIFNAKKILYNV